MSEKETGPAVATAGPGVHQGLSKPSPTAGVLQPKWRRVLRGFLDRGAQGLNRFEAQRELRDHVLPTTVDQLQKRGLILLRRDECVQGAFGDVHCARYWLAPESIQRARELVGVA